MPMFDIEDSGDVSLVGNETSDEKLLKAKRVGDVVGRDNKANAVQKNESTSRVIGIGVVVGVLVLVILGVVVHYVPAAREFIYH